MPETQLATFVVDGYLLGVDVRDVQEVIRHQEVTRVPLAPAAVGGLISLRGQVVTAIDLRRRLGLPPRAEGERPMNVVVRVEDEVVSLLVDSIGDVVHVTAEAFAPPPATLDGAGRELVRGTYPLDGRLLLALDVHRATDVADRAG